MLEKKKKEKFLLTSIFDSRKINEDKKPPLYRVLWEYRTILEIIWFEAVNNHILPKSCNIFRFNDLNSNNIILNYLRIY